MDLSLREIVVPFLRQKGFVGSLPHFRRKLDDRINLLTFQHSLSHPKFVVEIANCSSQGITTHWGKEISSKKVTAHDMNERLRLGSDTHHGDYWFDYSSKSLFSAPYKKLSLEILELWDEAENWWKRDPFDQRNR